MHAPSDPWIRLLRPVPRASMRLFLFPYAGGGAGVFRGWPEHLPTFVEPYAVQLPGREQRVMDPPFTAMPPLAEATAARLVPYMDRPSAFLGHSMGALVAFETARHLRRAGAPLPAHLFVSGRRAPQLPPNKPAIHQLPDDAFLAELRDFNGTPEAVLESDELMALLLPLLRADFAVCETYTYQCEPPLPCSLDAFGGREDDDVPLEDLRAWRPHTLGEGRCGAIPRRSLLHTQRAHPVPAARLLASVPAAAAPARCVTTDRIME